MRVRLAFAALAIIVIALGAIFVVAISDMRQREALRQVHFEISCGAAVQRSFDRATARLHAMAYVEAERAYTAIAALEPDCAMAYWGVAMSRLKRPIAITPLPDDLRTARDALQRAADAKIATPRERAYLAALELLVGDGDPAGWQDRTGLYENAMAELAARQPNDREATIFYALALNMAALPSDKKFQQADEGCRAAPCRVVGAAEPSGAFALPDLLSQSALGRRARRGGRIDAEHDRVDPGRARNACACGRRHFLRVGLAGLVRVGDGR